MRHLPKTAHPLQTQGHGHADLSQRLDFDALHVAGSAASIWWCCSSDSTVTPQRPSYNAVVSDAQNDAMMVSNVDDESAMSNDDPRQAMPGTNAYVNANIPMAMNGVPMFGGEFSKKGRSKACFECRRSKVLAS
jgi:hypothetical protein